MTVTEVLIVLGAMILFMVFFAWFWIRVSAETVKRVIGDVRKEARSDALAEVRRTIARLESTGFTTANGMQMAALRALHELEKR